MTFLLVNRVRETTISPGTGTATLAGAALGYQTFSAGVGANNTTYYVIADQSGANWEVGYGTVGSGGTTLARTTVLSSSNAGSLVNFSSGTQDVWVDYPANKAVFQDSTGTVSVPVLLTTSTTNTTPNLSFNASNTGFSVGASVSGSYLQSLLQNKSGTAGASANYVLSNDLGTDSSYYGEFGMNSSVYSSGTPTDFYSINNGIYFSGHDGDITFGSGNGFKSYFAWGSSGQSAHVINASGALGFSTNLGATPALSGTTGFGTFGQALISAGNAAAPAWGILGASGGGTGQSTLQSALAAFLGFTTTATAAGTTTLTNTSTFNQVFTGSSTQTIVLPVTSTLAQGWSYQVINNSTGNLTVNSSGSNLVGVVLPNSTAKIICILTSGTSAASWSFAFDSFASNTGSGANVLANSPTLITPVLGVASATSVNTPNTFGFKNRLIDAGFIVNQMAYTSGTALSAGVYGHDMWKAGSGGCTYTFTQGSTGVPIGITISAGSLQQVIEGALVADSTSYTLSWQGTAQGRINGGSYAASPITVTGLTAGSNLTVEFNTGTLAYPQLESGSYATSWDFRNYEQELIYCFRYYYSAPSQAYYGIRYGGTSPWLTTVFPVRMRTSPSVTVSFSTIFCSSGTLNSMPVYGVTTDNLSIYFYTSNVSVDFGASVSYKADARL